MADIQLFPGMRLSPDGKEFKQFDREEDVPKGWLRETPEGFEKRKHLYEKKGSKAEKPVEQSDEPLDL